MPRSNLASLVILSQNVTIGEYRYHQLEQENLPRDVQIFEEHGQQVTYKTDHGDNAAESCHNVHPIHC